MSTHDVKFERNKITGRFYAKCETCGWVGFGDTFTEVQLRASTHDTEWVELDPLTGEEKQTSEAA